MGGHIEACEDCGEVRVAYNSCRNRHCPKCGAIEKEKWIMNREADLLPVKYFHVVFTVPDKLNSRYTHRTAISNDRIINVNDKDVTFTWKDYKNNYAKQTTTLTGKKFLGLFCMHILPPGFTRIRHYGFLSSASKRKSLALIRFSLNAVPPCVTIKKSWQEIAFERMGIQPEICKCCGGKMVITKTLPNRFFPWKRAPPVTNTSKFSNYCMIG